MGIIQEWLGIARQAAAGRPVAALRARIGRLAAVEPDALRFAFDAAAPAALGVPEPRLEIEDVPATRRCDACNTVFAFPGDGPDCPRCHSSFSTWLSGFELELSSLVLAPPPPTERPSHV